MKLRYCIKCVQPDTRPNAKFNEHGVCPACAYLQTIDHIDWEERKRELDEICEKYKSHRVIQPYDCIIGVSGGKDSTRQALYIKEVCGLKPLLVSLNYPPGQSVERGAYNLANLAELGFDILTVQPAPERWRKLVRKAFFEFTNWCRSTELALFSSVPRVAQAYQIPLIFWGENPALQLGDQKTMGRNGWDGNNLRNMNTLSGAKNDWLLGDGIQHKHLLQYAYPSVEEMDRAGLQIVYLGYFWNIWSQLDNGDFSVLRGLDIRHEPIEDIGDPYGVSALDRLCE